MNFEYLLKACPHWSAWGIDHPDRPGFRNSRRLLEEGKADFDFAVNWLEHHPIESRNSVGVVHAIEFTTRRRVSNGIVCLAVKALAIPAVIRGSQLHFN